MIKIRNITNKLMGLPRLTKREIDEIVKYVYQKGRSDEGIRRDKKFAKIIK